jgi:hypothetical protein
MTKITKGTIFNFLQVVGYTIAGFAGGGMNLLAQTHIMKYNWLTGHLLDFAMPAEFTATGLMFSGAYFNNNKLARTASLFLPPILSTLAELKLLGIPGSSTYDPQDIACYFAGSFLAYGLSKANEKGMFDNLFRRLLEKKSLEKIVNN